MRRSDSVGQILWVWVCGVILWGLILWSMGLRWSGSVGLGLPGLILWVGVCGDLILWCLRVPVCGIGVWV